MIYRVLPGLQKPDRTFCLKKILHFLLECSKICRLSICSSRGCGCKGRKRTGTGMRLPAEKRNGRRQNLPGIWLLRRRGAALQRLAGVGTRSRRELSDPAPGGRGRQRNKWNKNDIRLLPVRKNGTMRKRRERRVLVSCHFRVILRRKYCDSTLYK